LAEKRGKDEGGMATTNNRGCQSFGCRKTRQSLWALKMDAPNENVEAISALGITLVLIFPNTIAQD
jgi:hypothetical protein